MAEIYLASSRGFGGFEKSLVIKRLHPHYNDDVSFVQMLMDEARITVQLQHANIVQIFDLGKIGGQYYIAMEYVEGKDLFQVLRELHTAELQMPVEAAAYVAAELCHGLHYAHCKADRKTGDPLEVIHRDISPQNILVSWAGEVKIADFGIVKAAQRSTHTEAGVIKGKFYYMSPEQALGQDIDFRSDIFSAGIVLYEALTATPLYDETNEAQLMRRVQAADFIPPREVRPDVPPALEQICLKALAHDRTDRYQTALEMGRDLSEFIVARGRSFTKVDLGDFMAALYRDGVRAAPIQVGGLPPSETRVAAVAPASVMIDSPDDTLADQALAVPQVPGGLDRNDPTLADQRIPTLPPPLPGSTSVDARRAAAARSVPPPPPRLAAPAPPTLNTAEVPQEIGDVSDPDARTTRLPKAAIAQMNAAMLAARESQTSSPALPPAVVGPDPVVVSAPAVAAPPKPIRPPARSEHTTAETPQHNTSVVRIPTSEPMPLRIERGRQAQRFRTRERQLKLALAVVCTAILAVTSAIFWLLITPIEVASLATTEAATNRVRPKSRVATAAPRSASGTPRAARRKAAAPGEEAAERVDRDEDDSQPVRIRIATASEDQRYKLYVDGELTVAEGGLLTLPAGRHTFQAKLLPQGTMTAKQTIELGAGAKHEVELKAPGT
jgi:hypothetical protein